MIRRARSVLRRITPLRRLARRLYLRRMQPSWHRAEPVAGERAGAVLVATSVGSHLVGSTLESLLAAALAQRGAEVHVLLCDADLPACSACTLVGLDGVEAMVRWGPRRDLCPGCFDPAAAMYRRLGVTVHRYGDHLTEEDRREARVLAATTPLTDIPTLVLDGMAVGDHANAGALRFFARASIAGESGAEPVQRRFLEAAVLTARSMQHLLRSTTFEAAVFHHGIYVPQGIIGEVARHEGVRVVNWVPAYRAGTFVFSHRDTYHHTLMDEPTSEWEGIEWSDELEAMTLDYLASRYQGMRDWITFVDQPNEDAEDLERELGIDLSKPTIGMLTNVMWDAQLHYPANAFADMREWVMETIRHFAGRPDLQLLIRVHPAEIRGNVLSRQPIIPEIASEFPRLPPNVFIIPPESSASTYAAMAHCDSVLIYGTKTGVELTAVGIPVVVAGEAWIRNKGLTMDASSKSDYLAWLDRLPLGARLDAATVTRARKYAFHFFFRRMIPCGFVEPTKDDRLYTLTTTDPSVLGVGADPGLDLICDGILHGHPFVYRMEDQVALRARGAGAPPPPGRAAAG